MNKHLLIFNGIVQTLGPQGVIKDGYVLVAGSKIKAVGHHLPAEIPEGTKKIDARGGMILPGFVDPHSHIGIFESGLGAAGVDGNEENHPVTPQMRAIDGVNPFDPEFKKAREQGVTTVVTGPGSANPIAGQFAALKTYGTTISEMLIKEPLAMKMSFGENPKQVHGGRGRIPSTRMGTAAVIREALYQALVYAQKKEQKSPDLKIFPEFDLGMEYLVPVVQGEMLVKAHAHRADDIMTALRIRDEFNLKMTIEHATEGHLIVEELKRRKQQVILGPCIGFPHKNETFHQDEKSAGILEKAGVPVAIMTDLPGMHEEHLRISAGICHRKGMSEYGALAAITIVAAKMIGLEDRIGSLESGKDADITIFDRNPITQVHAQCLASIIDGKLVFMMDQVLTVTE